MCACHNTKAKATGLDSSLRLTLDDVDFANVGQHAQKLETVARKLRAGMMPPVGMPRPDKDAYHGMLTFLQTELDKAAVPHMPPPGLHRLNRTEYQNAIQDLLNLDIDPGKYLPNDDSTSGFDNIAGALGISSTLVEAYVSAAEKISRLAIGEPEGPTLAVYRTPENTSQNYHIEGLPFGTRGGLLVKHVFPSDGEYTVTVTPIFGDNMTPTGFGSVPCERLEVSLDGERLELLDWKGGGRQDAAVCRGEKTAAVNSGQSGSISAAKMQVKFKTTAGLHALGATFLETNFAPVLDLDKQFVRTTLQTGPTPGYTFFPHVGTVRIEGPFNAVRSEVTPSRKAIFVCKPTAAAAGRGGLRAANHHQPCDDCLPASGDRSGRGPADGVLPGGPKRRRLRRRASRWRWRGFSRRRSSSTASKRSRRGPTVRTVADKVTDVSHQRHRSGVAAVVLPLEPRSRSGADEDRGRRTAEGSRRARAAGQAHAEGPARRGDDDQLRGTVAEPARPAGIFAAAGRVSRLTTSRWASRCGAKWSCCSTASSAKTGRLPIC